MGGEGQGREGVAKGFRTTGAGEEKQVGRGQKEALPESGLDLYHSHLCQTCLKLAWQELSLKERSPGSRGEPTERPISCSAWRLILTFPRALIPTPETPFSDSVEIHNVQVSILCSPTLPFSRKMCQRGSSEDPAPFPSAPPHPAADRQCACAFAAGPISAPPAFPAQALSLMSTVHMRIRQLARLRAGPSLHAFLAIHSTHAQ